MVGVRILAPISGRIRTGHCSLSKFDFGGALAALVLGWFGDGGDVGVAAEVFAEGAAEDAHAGAVDDADAGQAGEEGAVEEAFYFGLGFVGGAADDVDLGGHVVGVVVRGGDRDAATFARRFEWRDYFYGFDLGDVGDGGAHLHGADGDFEGLCVDDPIYAGLAAEGFEFDEVAYFDAFEDVGLGGGVVPVGAVGVGYDSGVELLGELAAQGGHAAVGVAGDFLRYGFVVDGFDGFAELVSEVFEEGVELGFELFGAGFLLDAAFDLDAGLFAREFALALLHGLALGGGGGELVVKLVEEGSDVGGLGGHLGAGRGDDVWLEAEAGCDVEAGGGSGDAEAQLVGGGEGVLVEAHGGVEDAGVVGGVDLERGEVGGDSGPGVEREEVGGDGYGEGCALFGVGGGAELVEQDERAGGGFAGDAVEIDDVGGEAGEVALDGLGVADVGVDAGEEREVGGFGGDGNAGLGHEGEKAEGFEGDGFAAGVGAAEDELLRARGEGDGEGDRGSACGVFAGFEGFGSHAEFEERVAGADEGESLRVGGDPCLGIETLGRAQGRGDAGICPLRDRR